MSRIGLVWWFFVLLLVNGVVEAATYSLDGGDTSSNPPPCRNDKDQALNWSHSGSTFTCAGRVTLASGDVLQVVGGLGHITIEAKNGFSLNNNTIGTSSKNITLRSEWGAINAIGSNNIFGSVSSGSGEVNLTGTTVNGSVNGSGTVTLTGGSVASHVSGTNGVTTNGTRITGNVSASNVINLSGGSITGDVSGNCCKITLSNGLTLIGNISLKSNDIVINDSSVTGNIITENTVSLNNGTVYGNVQAATWHDKTISGFGNSRVYGACTPAATDPVNLCITPTTLSCLADNFNRTTLGNTWAVTSRNGSFGVPRIISNRLRLTDNSGNVATGATVQRLVPAAGNLVQIEFKYYAYAGNGADGVAVIFSDAAVTPQPGGYGGSLGYAQLNGTSGFSGGWLGIALDEFGNFSNPSETRVGGPGARADSVSIRGSGSGTTGYRYLRGTAANLNPGIDVSGSTAGPGHTYRITLDSRTSGRTLVSVERNTGSGFATLIAPFNVLAEQGQAALPQNFFVTFTGSTGGSNNIHELDDLSFCADRLDPIGQQIDHFRFEYSSDAVTCNPQQVTVRACQDSACSNLFTAPVAVTLAPSTGWTAAAPATVSGGNVLSFSGGVATTRLRSGTVGPVTVGVIGSLPATKPLSVPVCSTANCRINYADSGFIFDVPTLTSAKPQANIPLRAVRSSNNAQACVPGFANVTRTLQFSSTYVDPGSGTQPVVVNGTSVGTSPSNVSLAFDATGSAPLTVRYDDAGQMRLKATYSGSAANGDSGLSMSGTDDFVTKPYGLCLQTDATCSSASATCAVFPNGVRAGDEFPLRIRAVGWQVDGEALTAEALCAGNITTPNFQLSNIALSSTVQAPLPGENGDVTPGGYDHVRGSATTTQVSVSEVGVFTITATPGPYLGEPMSGGTSALVGRFVPAYLGASGNASLAPACSTFSYQGQWMGFAPDREPSLTVTAYNRAGGVTHNYDRPAFWKLAAPTAGSYVAFSDNQELALHGDAAWEGELASRNARLRLSADADPAAITSGADDGDGRRTYRWPGHRLMYQAPNQPTRSDLPFWGQVRQEYGSAQLREVDAGYEVCVGTGSGCQDFSYDFTREPGSELRLGRLSLGNAHGSELQGLSLPLRIESWRDGAFQTETQDTCSAPLLGDPAPVAGTFTGNLSEGETTPSRSGPAAGIGQILMSAPGAGNDGSVQVELPGLPEWLLYDWSGSERQRARGLVSFGIYQGPKPLIFRREVYR